ncbi:unnamed protein product [Pleuronectes platessa]|uniref:Uncharacterized protein n=1 Tax=Pleuronectes platessa TaxID=8262 RepID=A0A9N7VAU2_PLEPL|nr:unnamed protein product [Pleuronectes platessa]
MTGWGGLPASIFVFFYSREERNEKQCTRDPQAKHNTPRRREGAVESCAARLKRRARSRRGAGESVESTPVARTADSRTPDTETPAAGSHSSGFAAQASSKRRSRSWPRRRTPGLSHRNLTSSLGDRRRRGAGDTAGRFLLLRFGSHRLEIDHKKKEP